MVNRALGNTCDAIPIILPTVIRVLTKLDGLIEQSGAIRLFLRTMLCALPERKDVEARFLGVYREVVA